MKKDRLKRKKMINKFTKTKRKEDGITLIALVITTIFSYDEKLKCSNYNGFLLETIWVKNHKFSNI